MAEYDKLKNDETVKKWLKRVNARQSTARNYCMRLQKYIEFTGLTPYKLLQEAKKEQREAIDVDDMAIYNRRVDFRAHLQDNTDLSPHSISGILATVKSFYTSAGLKVPKLQNQKPANSLIDNRKFLKKEEIFHALGAANQLMRAIMLVGCSSGLAANEIRNLKIRDFKEGYDSETKITTLSIHRIKTDTFFTTFLSPEANDAVMTYLMMRENSINPTQKIYSDDGYLFIEERVSPKFDPANIETEEVRKITEMALVRKYLRVAENAGMVNPYGYNAVRSHGMRKFFNSTLRNNGFDFQFVEHMMGHKMNKTYSAYLDIDPEKLKERYIECVPFLKIIKEGSKLSDEAHQKLLAKLRRYEGVAIVSQVERYEHEKIKKVLKKAAPEEYEQVFTDSVDNWI